MNAIEHFEIRAEAFRFMTGQMAPGKDRGAIPPTISDDERDDLFQRWCDENALCITAMFHAFEQVMGKWLK